jgi:hypothetical protein
MVACPVFPAAVSRCTINPDFGSAAGFEAFKSHIVALANCHTFRATGITAYLLNGGSLEHAQAIAAHEKSVHDEAL